MKIDRVLGSHGLAIFVIGLALVLAGPRTARAQVFTNGDVFLGVGKSQVQWRRGNGTLVRTLTAAVSNNNFTAGMAFDSAGDLYSTMFDSQTVAVYDNSGDFLQTFGSGYNSDPESIVIDASNNVYVGQADGPHQILKFDSAGTPLAQYTVTADERGSDWIDLGSDLCTMYYTSEGTHVQRFNVCTGVQLPNLNATPLPGSHAFAHRIRASGDTLVADTEVIVRLDSDGSVIQTYTAPGDTNFFALNLDSDGTSFWSGDISNGDVLKFDIATGNILVRFNSGAGTNVLSGITVKGELTASAKPPSTVCATRNARFWFTHAYNFSDPTCATLLSALKANLGGINLGYMTLPAFFENSDGVKDANDALQEALGFYWKSNSRTGESGGSQNAKQSGSSLCKQRKLCSIELIAATANVRLLGTQPGNCTYFNGKTVTNFPADLLHQARVVLSGDDPTAVVSMKALLKTFNTAGLANDFPAGVVECSPTSTKTNKSIARDPTRQDTCPGAGNGGCTTAEAVFFPTNAANPFASAVYTRSVNLTGFQDSFQAPSCSSGGRDAVWKVKPTLGVSGRQFTVSTAGSNFDTMLSIWSGDCSTTNQTQVACTNQFLGVRSETLSFTTDGTNTFFIVGEGAVGQYGKLKIRVTSP